jgi:hypothetical protein
MKPHKLILIPLLIVCFGLVPNAQATDTDGALPLGNNANGIGVLTSLTSGAWNSGFGFEALNQNTIGNSNTATGLRALKSNTEGADNTANGTLALFSNTTGINNTAIGYGALYLNTSGAFHTAVGIGALQNCIAPPDFAGNTAIGGLALFSDTTGNFNTAIGAEALALNTTGGNNVAIGLDALVQNTSGSNAMFSNTEGDFNTATGSFALFSNLTGNLNTAVGKNALVANTTGDSNTALGNEAGSNLTTGIGNIYIGDGVQAGATNEPAFIRIGAASFEGIPYDTFISGIYQRPVGPAPLPVLCASNGKLTANASSRRFKHDIKPIDKSEAVLALKPVTFAYNNDTTNSLDFGLIAEEVAEVAPDLVIRDKEGKPFSVHYQGVNAMLLNEFIKEHRKNEEQGATIARLQKQVEALTTGLQKVSAQLEASKPAPQVVNNP